jgi:hypothetical protein
MEFTMKTAVMNTESVRSIQAGAKKEAAGTVPQLRRSAKRLEIDIEPRRLCAAFGVEDATVATRLLSQLANVLIPAVDDNVDATAISGAISLVQDIGPQGGLEAMTATLLVASQHAAIDCMRRAAHPEQTPGGRSMYLSLGMKAARTYAQLLEGLNHGRGKGGTKQEIVVTHVSVESGAQAIVGTITPGRG